MLSYRPDIKPSSSLHKRFFSSQSITLQQRIQIPSQRHLTSNPTHSLNHNQTYKHKHEGPSSSDRHFGLTGHRSPRRPLKEELFQLRQHPLREGLGELHHPRSDG